MVMSRLLIISYNLRIRKSSTNCWYVLKSIRDRKMSKSQRNSSVILYLCYLCTQWLEKLIRYSWIVTVLWVMGLFWTIKEHSICVFWLSSSLFLCSCCPRCTNSLLCMPSIRILSIIQRSHRISYRIWRSKWTFLSTISSKETTLLLLLLKIVNILRYWFIECFQSIIKTTISGIIFNF